MSGDTCRCAFVSHIDGKAFILTSQPPEIPALTIWGKLIFLSLSLSLGHLNHTEVLLIRLRICSAGGCGLCMSGFSKGIPLTGGVLLRRMLAWTLLRFSHCLVLLLRCVVLFPAVLMSVVTDVP